MHAYFDKENKNITTFHTKFNKNKKKNDTAAADADAGKKTTADNSTNVEIPEVNLDEDETLEITAP